MASVHYSGVTNWLFLFYNEPIHMFYFLSLEKCHTPHKKSRPIEEEKEYHSRGVKYVLGDVPQKSIFALRPSNKRGSMALFAVRFEEFLGGTNDDGGWAAGFHG